MQQNFVRMALKGERGHRAILLSWELSLGQWLFSWQKRDISTMRYSRLVRAASSSSPRLRRHVGD